MDTNVYERIVSELEQKWTRTLEYEGRNAIYALKVDSSYDFDLVRERAVDAIEKTMFDSEEWELVRATEISDIACEIGNRVAEDYWLDYRAGEEQR